MRNHSSIARRCCLFAGAALLASGSQAFAVSCTLSSAMSATMRTPLAGAARTIGEEIVQDNTAGLKGNSASFLTQDFSSVSSFVDGLKQKLQGATVTVDDMYELNARDLTSATDTQFFCGSNSTPLLITVSLSSLPPGEYALTIVHATGVKDPQQLALILQNSAPAGAAPEWQLAGYFVRPLSLAGHSGVWFWEQARLLKTQGALLSAAVYYQAALYLSRAADIYTSNNFERLEQEASALQPAGLNADHPLILMGPGGQQFTVSKLSINAELGELDLDVTAAVPQLGTDVASRTTAIASMNALLQKDPDIQHNFQGIWLHATAANGQTYLLQQPMSALGK